jgi:hypothetical protein
MKLPNVITVVGHPLASGANAADLAEVEASLSRNSKSCC